MKTEDIIADYISWSKCKPFVQEQGTASAWTRPTAKQFYRYLTSNKNRVEIGKKLANLQYEEIAEFAMKLWKSVAVKPYIWSVEMPVLDNYTGFDKFKEENPDAAEIDYFTRCSGLLERFEHFFWSEVILPFKDLGEIEFVPVDKYEKVCKAHTDAVDRNIHLKNKVTALSLDIADKERALAAAKNAKTFISILAGVLVPIVAWCTWLFTRVDESPNVKAAETSQEFDITVSNPQNKDIILTNECT